MSFKLITLKKRQEFLRLRSGPKWSTPCFVLQGAQRKPAGDEADSAAVADIGPRFGFIVTKKLGNAVVRNRIKRRLRAAVRQIAPEKAAADFDYVLIGRQAALTHPYDKLLSELETAFDRLRQKRGGQQRKPGKRRGNSRNQA